jgi:hypothetical protein
LPFRISQLQPSSLQNLATPWPKGYKPSTTRRSAAVDKALRMARKLCPEAVAFCAKVMRDEGMRPEHRLRAVEIILANGLPKGDSAARRALDAESGVTSLRVEFVAADGSVVSFKQDQLPPAPGIIERPFATIDHEPDSQTQC